MLGMLSSAASAFAPSWLPPRGLGVHALTASTFPSTVGVGVRMLSRAAHGGANPH